MRLPPWLPDPPPGKNDVKSDGGGDRYVGTTLGCEADYAVDRHSVVSAYYVHFFAGDVVRKAAGRDSDYVGLLWTFKF